MSGFYTNEPEIVKLNNSSYLLFHKLKNVPYNNRHNWDQKNTNTHLTDYQTGKRTFHFWKTFQSWILTVQISQLVEFLLVNICVRNSNLNTEPSSNEFIIIKMKIYDNLQHSF